MPGWRVNVKRGLAPAQAMVVTNGFALCRGISSVSNSRRDRREAPLKRVNPSGNTRWVARYTDGSGNRRSAGTFERRGEAQQAIDAAYAQPDRIQTLGDYATTWIDRYPRSQRTNASSSTRLKAVLDVAVEGQPLRDWPLLELRRRHAVALVDHMLREQGRAVKGAVGVLRTLSMLMENALDDEHADLNPFKGVRIRANDPRVRKAARPIRVWTFAQMREFAAAGRSEVRAATMRPKKHRRSGEDLFYSAADYEPMLLAFALTNLRVGEVLALRMPDFGGDTLHVRGNAYEGVITEGDTEEKRHVRAVPCPKSLAEALTGMPVRIDTDLLFPTPKGTVWHDSNFRRDVWEAAQIASGLDIRPHECRHSWITHLRAAGIDPADLAQASGHDVDTATRHYVQPLGLSADLIRETIG